jgi:chemotaxis protein CheD
MRDLVIGMGDGGVSRDPDTVLVTYALGSCVAVMLHDPVAQVAGMVHYMLPESTESTPEPNGRPCRFADTAVPFLVRAALAQGGEIRRFTVSAAGGAQIMSNNSIFNIGKRNCLALRKALWKFGLVAHAEDTGGTAIRTVRLEVGSGRVWLQSPGGKQWEMNPHGRASAAPMEACPWR